MIIILGKKFYPHKMSASDSKYTNEELQKYKKNSLLTIIKDYCEKEGKHITNLAKATKPKLIELIIKYNMSKVDPSQNDPKSDADSVE